MKRTRLNCTQKLAIAEECQKRRVTGGTRAILEIAETRNLKRDAQILRTVFILIEHSRFSPAIFDNVWRISIPYVVHPSYRLMQANIVYIA